MTASLLLVHGAGSGPWAFDGWDEAFPSVIVAACDLQRDVDPGHASMLDYADAVVEAARPLPRPLALCGWSMGGLVALLAAGRARPEALVLLEPSPPAEAQENDSAAPLERGTFDPEAVYGRFPDDVRSRPESSLARSERKRGLSVPEAPSRCLVVYGDDFADARGRRVALLYGAEERYFAGFGHWDLVRCREVREAVAAWLAG